MNENDVVLLLIGRQDSYAISSIRHVQGRLYSLQMNGEQHLAVVLVHSFDYYDKRYHLIAKKSVKATREPKGVHIPTLIVCYYHDTVTPIPVLSVRMSNIAKPYELPEEITDIRTQRHSKRGAQVVLGMYLSGMQVARSLLRDLPVPTRNRYLAKAALLNKRVRGRPVGMGKNEKHL